jgi:hypothetical protein
MTLLIAPWHWEPGALYPGSAIAEQYRRWDAAYVRNDVHVLGDVLSNGFSITTEGGETTDKQTYLVTFRGATPPKQYKTEMLRVMDTANRASVWTKETQVAPDGEKKLHWYLDTWVRERGTWRLLGSRTLREKHP